MISASVGVTVRLAKADPGGHTRAALTFAGTLSGVTGAQTLTFTFRKGSAEVCAPTAMVTPDAEGRFTAEIPIDGCPSTLFDGSDVTFDVRVGTTAVASGQRVNPVPYARYADQVGTPDCPVGYERRTDAATPTGRWICRRGADEVVRVGDGPSAFWIDRYEATIWTGRDGSGTNYNSDTEVDLGPIGLPRNGQTTRDVPAMFAASVAGRLPARWVTWFQASELCRASGKRLPGGNEWLSAARSTADPDPSSNGSGGICVTGQGAPGPRATGLGINCVSRWGAQDMIGNVTEWTDEWFAGAGSTSGSATRVNESIQAWPNEYATDATWNVNGAVDRGDTTVVGLPAAALRGGDWSAGRSSGVFALALYRAPSGRSDGSGFRCVIPR